MGHRSFELSCLGDFPLFPGNGAHCRNVHDVVALWCSDPKFDVGTKPSASVGTSREQSPGRTCC